MKHDLIKMAFETKCIQHDWENNEHQPAHFRKHCEKGLRVEPTYDWRPVDDDEEEAA